MFRKITDEEIIKIVPESISFNGVLRKLGIKVSGGSNSHIRKRIARLNLDTSHFTGKGYLKGKISHNRKSPEEIFVIRESDNRGKSYLLKRALLESGIEYKCSECLIGDTYNGKPIVLQIDHKNGNCLDDRKGNLRFLCPNCHSQTSNYGNKNKRV